MRTFTVASLFLLSASWVAVAQQPATPPASESGKLVIRPGGKGVETVRPGGSGGVGPDEKDGFIVIRPGGSGILTTTARSSLPVRPPHSPPITTALVAGLNVPPPEAQPDPKDFKDLKGKPLYDYWFVVSVDGQRVGWVNWAAKEVEARGKPHLFGVRHLELTVSRFGDTVKQWGEESTVETPDGTVLLTSMRQGLGKDQALALTGTVKGKTLEVKGEGAAEKATDTPWHESVVGIVREPRLFKELKLEKGASFSYPSYVHTMNVVVKTTITFEGEETKKLWEARPEQKLLKFSTKPEPIGKVKLPASTTWVDAATFEPLLMEVDFPALGDRLTFLRTTKEAATAPVVKPVELFNVQSIRLDREIPGIHGKGSVVYKVTVTRDDEPESVFATDPRQQVKNLDEKAKTFELHVSASRGPDRNAAAQPAPGKEFTESNYFINWDNDAVRGHAARALAGLPATATAWERAVAVERWVKANMKAFEFSQAMATADNVAKTLSGDCTEYAMLSAALCRAAGVPSRTALGVVYAPAPGGKPFLAYHMWYEVYADGQWLPLDATLGLGGVGPGHIKIFDHSWHNEKTFAPLLPVLRTLSARPAVSVLKVSP